MSTSRLRPLLAALSAAAGVLAGIAAVRRRRRLTSPELFSPEAATRGQVPLRPTTSVVADDLTGGRRGDPDDRGRGPAFGLDVERLRDTSGFEPVVQYLTYIQERRGDASHLLFVRYDDLDAMASIDGQPTPAFLERLEQLGVVVSNN